MREILSTAARRFKRNEVTGCYTARGDPTTPAGRGDEGYNRPLHEVRASRPYTM